jgi:hypothetical protein
MVQTSLKGCHKISCRRKTGSLGKEDAMPKAPEEVYTLINGCRSYLGGATKIAR